MRARTFGSLGFLIVGCATFAPLLAQENPPSPPSAQGPQSAQLDPQNPLGFYVGAGFGWASSHFSYLDDYASLRTFDGNDVGWKALIGVRPIRWLGAEIEYVDFGRANLQGGPEVVGPNGLPLLPDEFYGAHLHQTAAQAFAVGYVPLPWRWVDLFGKVGVARLWSSYHSAGYYPDACIVNGSGVCVPVGQVSYGRTEGDTDFAYGGGAQVHFGAFAVRAEFEAIRASTSINPGNPHLFSVGFTWKFF